MTDLPVSPSGGYLPYWMLFVSFVNHFILSTFLRTDLSLHIVDSCLARRVRLCKMHFFIPVRGGLVLAGRPVLKSGTYLEEYEAIRSIIDE